MAQVFILKTASTALLDAAAVNANDPLQTFTRATRVRVTHDHAGGSAHIIEVRDGDNTGTVLGSCYLNPGESIVLAKRPQDVVVTATAQNDVFGVGVGVEG